MAKNLSPKIYDDIYFKSERCEGFCEYQKDQLSPIKNVEIECLNLQKNDFILDLGCGRGDVASYLSKGKFSFRAIDYSKDAVKLTQDRVSKKHREWVTEQDALKLEFAENTFDKILVGDVIEHMTFEKAQKIVNNAFKVLKPGGVLLLHTAPNLWFKKITYPIVKNIIQLLGYAGTTKKLVENIDATYKYHVDEYSPLDMRRLLMRSKFSQFKTWIHPDVLRTNSENYLSPLKKNPLISISAFVINHSPLIYLFGNDLFALAIKTSVNPSSSAR